jgi:hypothetical protein
VHSLPLDHVISPTTTTRRATSSVLGARRSERAPIAILVQQPDFHQARGYHKHLVALSLPAHEKNSYRSCSTRLKTATLPLTTENVRLSAYVQWAFTWRLQFYQRFERSMSPMSVIILRRGVKEQAIPGAHLLASRCPRHLFWLLRTILMLRSSPAALIRTCGSNSRALRLLAAHFGCTLTHNSASSVLF